MSGFDDIGASNGPRPALTADTDWLELIDRVGPAYAEGASQAMYRLASWETRALPRYCRRRPRRAPRCATFNEVATHEHPARERHVPRTPHV